MSNRDGWNHHDSSHIEKSKYNPMEYSLDIQFQNGAVYRYHGVTPQENTQMLNAPSVGEYHAENIKNNKMCVRIK
jgi:KTSC domain